MSRPRATWGAPCLTCGAESPPLNHFCTACGEPIHDVGWLACPGCGMPNPWSAAFCGRCGGGLGPRP